MNVIAIWYYFLPSFVHLLMATQMQETGLPSLKMFELLWQESATVSVQRSVENQVNRRVQRPLLSQRFLCLLSPTFPPVSQGPRRVRLEEETGVMMDGRPIIVLVAILVSWTRSAADGDLGAPPNAQLPKAYE